MDGYGLSFVNGEMREPLAVFPTFTAAARALRAAETAAQNLAAFGRRSILKQGD